MKQKKSIKRQQSPWIAHLKVVYAEMKAENPDIKLKDAMKEAKKTYKRENN